MSGAGRTTALRCLEDLGYFCVDNIPPALIGLLVAELQAGGEVTRLGVGVERLKVRGDSLAAGKSLRELALRAVTGSSVLAVQRGTQLLPNPDADFRLEENDVLVLLGGEDQICRALELVDPRVPLS
jgi:Trk K+ transport system NAD-binding subunit